MESLINSWLNGLTSIIQANLWLAPFMALLAGILTSFLPCSLSSIPLVMGYVGGIGIKEQNPKRAFWLSATFSVGMAVTLTVLGTAASLLGRLIQGTGSWWYLVLGTLMVMMALQTWEIFNFIPSTYALSKNQKRGFIGAFIAGILGGVFSSPCATPMLVVLLAMVAEQESLLRGIILLLLYSLGHSFLVIIAGTSIGFVKKLSANPKYGTASKIIRIVTGTAILSIGLYMFYLGF